MLKDYRGVAAVCGFVALGFGLYEYSPALIVTGALVGGLNALAWVCKV